MKRGYSREFTKRTERRVRFEVDAAPPVLLERTRAKGKKQGYSMRGLTLTLWKLYADGDITLPDAGTKGEGDATTGD
jgi:hypothetical protein